MFLLASFKTVTIGSRVRISVQLFFSAIGRYSSLLLFYWLIFSSTDNHSRLSEPFLGSQAASCTHFQGQIAAVGSLNRFTERIFNIIEFFIEASKNYDLGFSIKKSLKIFFFFNYLLALIGGPTFLRFFLYIQHRHYMIAIKKYSRSETKHPY